MSEKAGKKPAAKKTQKQEQAQAAEQQRRRTPEIPRSSFNFIASRWESRRRRQRTALVVGSVVGTALVGVVSAGVWARSGTSAAEAEIVAMDEQTASAQAELRSIFGGAENIVAQVESGVAALKIVYGQDLSPQDVIAQINATATAGMRLDQITFEPVKGGVVEPPPTSAPDEFSAAPDSTASPNGEDADGEGAAPTTTAAPQVRSTSYVVKIQMVGSSYDDPIAWKAALSQLGFLEDIELVYSGDPGSGIRMNATATLVPPAGQPRLAALAPPTTEASGG